MRTPFAAASSWYLSMMRRMNQGSPVARWVHLLGKTAGWRTCRSGCRQLHLKFILL